MEKNKSNTFENTAVSTINKYGMLKCTHTVAVGFSNGADSTALLHFLNEYIKKNALNIKLLALHLNHCLRGVESDNDQLSAASFCKKHGIEFITKSADVKSEMLKGESIEMAARRIRYNFFRKATQKYGYDGCKTATAHNSNDNLETVLMNISRGSGIKGIGGISPVNGNLIRPLINISRIEIERYCEKHKLNYVNDSTNKSDEYLRNKVRSRIVPQITEVFSEFLPKLAELSELSRADDKYLDSEAAAKSGLLLENNKAFLDRASFNTMENCLKSRAIQTASIHLTQKSASKDFCINAVKLAETAKGTKRISCENGVIFEVEYNSINIYTKNNIANDIEKKCDYPLPLKIGVNEISTNAGTLTVNATKAQLCSAEDIGSKDKSIFIPEEYIKDGITLRSRRTGDTYKTNRHTKSVKKLFIDSKLPLGIRESIPIFEHNGRIIFIPGFKSDILTDAFMCGKFEGFVKIEVKGLTFS